MFHKLVLGLRVCAHSLLMFKLYTHIQRCFLLAKRKATSSGKFYVS
jgi:hypothetical protein